MLGLPVWLRSVAVQPVLPGPRCTLAVLGGLLCLLMTSLPHMTSVPFVMPAPSTMQNVEMMSAFFCSNSSVADGVIRSSMNDGPCVDMSFPGRPGSRPGSSRMSSFP